MVNIRKKLCSPLLTLTLLTATNCFLGNSSYAQQDCAPSATDATLASLESCVQILREEPVQKTYPEISEVANAVSEGQLPLDIQRLPATPYLRSGTTN
jgi:hypothetical protein